jgi:hypothetical protein
VTRSACPRSDARLSSPRVQTNVVGLERAVERTGAKLESFTLLKAEASDFL